MIQQVYLYMYLIFASVAYLVSIAFLAEEYVRNQLSGRAFALIFSAILSHTAVLPFEYQQVIYNIQESSDEEVQYRRKFVLLLPHLVLLVTASVLNSFVAYLLAFLFYALVAVIYSELIEKSIGLVLFNVLTGTFWLLLFSFE